MLLTFDGSTATNPFVFPQTSHVELSHPAIADQLLLAEHTDRPYENYRTGQTRSDGRSLLGAMRLRGNSYIKEQWECNFLVVGSQVGLFEQLVAAQQADLLPCSIVDRWIDGRVKTSSVWIEIDRQYLALLVGTSWFRLQFQLLEV